MTRRGVARLGEAQPYVYERGGAFESLPAETRARLEGVSVGAAAARTGDRFAAAEDAADAIFSWSKYPPRVPKGVPDYAQLCLEVASQMADQALAARERGEEVPPSPEPRHYDTLREFGEHPDGSGDGVFRTFLTEVDFFNEVDGALLDAEASIAGSEADVLAAACAAADALTEADRTRVVPRALQTETGITLATARYHAHRGGSTRGSDGTAFALSDRASPRSRAATASSIINRTLTFLRLRAQRQAAASRISAGDTTATLTLLPECVTRRGELAQPTNPTGVGCTWPLPADVDAGLWEDAKRTAEHKARLLAESKRFAESRRPLAALHAARRECAAAREREEAVRRRAVDEAVRRRISAALSRAAPERLAGYKTRLEERRKRAEELRSEASMGFRVLSSGRSLTTGKVVHHTL